MNPVATGVKYRCMAGPSTEKKSGSAITVSRRRCFRIMSSRWSDQRSSFPPWYGFRGIEPRSFHWWQSGYELRCHAARSTECDFALRNRKEGVFGCADVVPDSEGAGEDIEAAPVVSRVGSDFDIQRSRQFVSLHRDKDITRSRILDFDDNVERKPRIDASSSAGNRSHVQSMHACASSRSSRTSPSLRVLHEEIVLTRNRCHLTSCRSGRVES